MLNRRGTKAGLSSSYLVSSLVTGAVFLSFISVGLGSYFGASYLFLLNFIILGAMFGVYSFFVSWTGDFFSTFGDYLSSSMVLSLFFLMLKGFFFSSFVSCLSSNLVRSSTDPRLLWDFRGAVAASSFQTLSSCFSTFSVLYDRYSSSFFFLKRTGFCKLLSS